MYSHKEEGKIKLHIWSMAFPLFTMGPSCLLVGKIHLGLHPPLLGGSNVYSNGSQ